MHNFAPNLPRSWLEAELKPNDKKFVTTTRVKKFQTTLAEICGMHIFCGPMIIAPDSNNNLSPYYTNQQFKPQDWNAYTWWTRPDAPNVMTILNHSHESFYYYPTHNLIDVSIATCKDYDLESALTFMRDFWKPTADGIRYAFLSPDNPSTSWKIFTK